MSEYIVELTEENHTRLMAECDGIHEEIVRCRDCIYYKQDPDPIDPGWPMMCERTGDDMVEPYGFCAWAERKEVDA